MKNFLTFIFIVALIVLFPFMFYFILDHTTIIHSVIYLLFSGIALFLFVLFIIFVVGEINKIFKSLK